MKITKEWLEEKNACHRGVNWFLNQRLIEAIPVLKSLMKEDHHDWANWTLVRLMTRPQYLKYAIYSAEQVIDIYEKKYPDNKAPREAIEAAELVLREDTPVNREFALTKARAAAYAAADAAAYAAYAADAAASADAAAAYAAYAAAYAADAAAYAAYAAYAADARKQIITKILNYGISLLKKDQ